MADQDSLRPNGSAYTLSQISRYLSYVGLDESYHPSSSPVLDLEYLTTIFQAQITSFPYENLSIHYNPSHSILLDPQHLFTKLITSPRRGRGGYCMELSIFFSHILRALGFASIHYSGVRNRNRTDGTPQGPYNGYVHLVNIVTLPGCPQQYVLDAGFGGDGPTFPLPLTEHLVHRNSLGTQEIRYIRDWLPDQRFRDETKGALKHWIYEYRNAPDKPWNGYYAFVPEHEFTELDFENLNVYLSECKRNHQTYTVLVIRFLKGEEEEGEASGRKIRGKVMMVQGEVKQNLGGRTELVKVCKTEEERTETLKDLFGIDLTEEEKGAIKGWASELKGE
ncbi:PaNAT1 arylamine N-acetyltransferase encoded by the PaNAT1 protein [Cercophora samala]|uniref:PaNAT1 arylamine N-acetyltransferase encoded by the PaNAT1 protein n=1 Tax=Cercophora samala TaxID=330535 RepID=A0AA39ZJZ3_9PEZI|nr:PaNAT1 arylamine N-acetyltransferase encoded by the PaNAT1 protein [Cercophora samala]